MINTYKEKLHTIKAVQFYGSNISEISELIGDGGITNTKLYCDGNCTYLRTCHKDIEIKDGYYVIKNNLGYISLCDPDSFNNIFCLI